MNKTVPILPDYPLIKSVQNSIKNNEPILERAKLEAKVIKDVTPILERGKAESKLIRDYDLLLQTSKKLIDYPYISTLIAIENISNQFKRVNEFITHMNTSSLEDVDWKTYQLIVDNVNSNSFENIIENQQSETEVVAILDEAFSEANVETPQLFINNLMQKAISLKDNKLVQAVIFEIVIRFVISAIEKLF